MNVEQKKGKSDEAPPNTRKAVLLDIDFLRDFYETNLGDELLHKLLCDMIDTCSVYSDSSALVQQMKIIGMKYFNRSVSIDQAILDASSIEDYERAADLLDQKNNGEVGVFYQKRHYSYENGVIIDQHQLERWLSECTDHQKNKKLLELLINASMLKKGSDELVARAFLIVFD